jgi:AcrR family transcriptional regulator
VSRVTETNDRPLRADAERNRLRILDAAADEFAARGLAVTMDSIAARAGVGVGTVYRRFPDKGDLLEALFEERLMRIVALADEALERDDPWAALAEFIERGSEFQATNRALRQLLLGSAAGSEFALRARRLMRPKVAELVARAQASGDLRPDLGTLDVPMIQMMLATVMDFTADVAPETWRRVLGLVLDGLRASRDEPSELPVPPLDAETFSKAMIGWKGPGG